MIQVVPHGAHVQSVICIQVGWQLNATRNKWRKAHDQRKTICSVGHDGCSHLQLSKVLHHPTARQACLLRTGLRHPMSQQFGLELAFERPLRGPVEGDHFSAAQGELMQMRSGKGSRSPCKAASVRSCSSLRRRPPWAGPGVVGNRLGLRPPWRRRQRRRRQSATRPCKGSRPSGSQDHLTVCPRPHVLLHQLRLRQPTHQLIQSKQPVCVAMLREEGRSRRGGTQDEQLQLVLELLTVRLPHRIALPIVVLKLEVKRTWRQLRLRVARQRVGRLQPQGPLKLRAVVHLQGTPVFHGVEELDGVPALQAQRGRPRGLRECIQQRLLPCGIVHLEGPVIPEFEHDRRASRACWRVNRRHARATPVHNCVG
mmetsp:Transcript_148120/g.475720  ORF Transcript_148120/g.475720 Transcript_148120/m.475720 type:complete len:369 (-) Transcript_148120:85-1191(-)